MTVVLQRRREDEEGDDDDEKKFNSKHFSSDLFQVCNVHSKTLNSQSIEKKKKIIKMLELK